MKSVLFRFECLICLTLCNIIQHCHSISGKRYCLAQLPGILIWYDLLLGSNSISQVENFKSLISKKIVSPTKQKKKKISPSQKKEKKRKTENPQNIFANQGSEWTISGRVYSYDSSKSIILIILRQRFPACFDKIFYLDKLVISNKQMFGVILHFFKNTLKYICIYLK